MVHGILQFTPSIAFRYVLHRCESRDIRCRESFVFQTDFASREREANEQFFINFLGTVSARLILLAGGHPSGNTCLGFANRVPKAPQRLPIVFTC